MIQVKEFLDTDSTHAENKANEFLAGLDEDQIVSVLYGSYTKSNLAGPASQRSSILVVYRASK